jgi:hypothetical protein
MSLQHTAHIGHDRLDHLHAGGIPCSFALRTAAVVTYAQEASGYVYTVHVHNWLSDASVRSTSTLQCATRRRSTLRCAALCRRRGCRVSALDAACRACAEG